jgi:hypothetical protein
MLWIRDVEATSCTEIHNVQAKNIARTLRNFSHLLHKKVIVGKGRKNFFNQTHEDAHGHGHMR